MHPRTFEYLQTICAEICSVSYLNLSPFGNFDVHDQNRSKNNLEEASPPKEIIAIIRSRLIAFVLYFDVSIFTRANWIAYWINFFLKAIQFTFLFTRTVTITLSIGLFPLRRVPTRRVPTCRVPTRRLYTSDFTEALTWDLVAYLYSLSRLPHHRHELDWWRHLLWEGGGTYLIVHWLTVYGRGLSKKIRACYLQERLWEHK